LVVVVVVIVVVLDAVAFDGVVDATVPLAIGSNVEDKMGVTVVPGDVALLDTVEFWPTTRPTKSTTNHKRATGLRRT
jgi:hypothetical protein